MPTYRFRLQKVMEAKKCAEDQKKQELAQAMRVLDREKRLLLALESRGHAARTDLLERDPGPLNVMQEARGRARFARLMDEVARQTAIVEHSEERVCFERDALVECAKERRILENLRERGLLQCMREWLRREQKDTDEVGQQVFLRRTNRTAGRSRGPFSPEVRNGGQDGRQDTGGRTEE